MGIAEVFGFRPAREAQVAQAVYAAIVERAREPRFFSTLGVPDTVDGRFETLALHLFLVLRRLKSDPSEAAAGLSRAVLEAFVSDMDRSLREMGAADLGVSRRVKAMAEGLYGRMKAYEVALEEKGASALEAALRRNLYGTVGMPEAADVAAVSRYVRRQHTALAAQPLAALQAGELAFLPLSRAIDSEVPP